MRQQPFARFALVSAALTVSIPSVISAQSTEKSAIRADRSGDPLPKRAVMRLGNARFAQPFPRSVAFSPGGKFLASAGNDKRIRLWDVDTGKELRALLGHTSQVNCIVVSADAKWLASGSQNHEVILWDVDTAKVRRRFGEHNAPVAGLALSPNRKVLAAGFYGGAVQLWDTETGKQKLALPVEKGYYVNALTFAPDSKHFAYTDRYSSGIHLVDITTGKEIQTFKGHRNNVTGLIFTAKGDTLLSSSYDRTIRAWDVASGKEQRRYGDGKQRVQCLALAPDGKTLAYEAGWLVHFADFATNKDLVPPWKPSPLAMLSIAYSADGKKVAVGGNGIAILDTATGKPLHPLPESVSPIHQIAYAADSKVLAVWRWWEDMTIELWDTVKWRRIAKLRPKNGRFASMAFSPNRKFLTTAEGYSSQGKYQGILCCWDVQTGERQREFPQDGGWIDLLSYAADGKSFGYLQMLPSGDAFVFRDAATGKERGQIPAPKIPEQKRNPRLSPDGRVLAWAAPKSAVGLWDTETGKLLRHFGNRRAGYNVLPAFAPDGRTIATPAGQRMENREPIEPEIVLWETATGKERLHITPNEGQVSEMVFSPNGRLLASVSEWGTIRLWDSWTGKEIGRFTGHRGRINTIAFAPDGQTLASGGADNTVLIWNVSGLAPSIELASKPLSREQLAHCWDDLIHLDAASAYRTIAELARRPDQTERFLKDKLAAHTGVDSQRLARLIADLDNDDFQKRQKASNELAKLGRLAEAALRMTLEEKPSAELKRRIHELLDKLDPRKDDPETLRLLRVIEVLERLGTAGARRLLRKMVETATSFETAREAQASLQRLAKVRKGIP